MSRILAILLGVLLVVLVIYVGVRLRGGQIGSSTPQLNVDLQEIIPEVWQAHEDGLVRINIDGDTQQEWMLFYRYDDAQLGGVIYDAQNRPRGNDSIPIPEQTSAYLVPYRLLPDYTVPKTSGYLGNEDIDYRLAAADGDAENPNKEYLQVRGISRSIVNRFSLFWWIDKQLGYGGAHASTPGWFSMSYDHPYDWNKWDTGTPVIKSLWAWESQTDRSNFCRRAQWRLDEGEDPKLESHFVAFYDGDITFCSGKSPVDPAFPEAQVMAYLKDGKSNRWQNPSDPNIPQYRGATIKRITAPVVLDDHDKTSANEGMTVLVDVDFTYNDVSYSETWSVNMIRPKTTKDAVRWRIVDAVAR
ncbi:MAG: hypothetical protein GY759_01045 [Chloroflexi bacterium]|nr:hypothetical protein [Chloroflexota bacterium]